MSAATKSKKEKVLSEEALKELGFYSKWPDGNPKEPWWYHATMDLVFMNGRPTAQQLFDKIRADGIYQGAMEVRQAIRTALQI